MAFLTWYRQAILHAILASIFFSFVSLARPGRYILDSAGTETLRHSNAPRSFAPNFQMKILCVGDSITVGIGDSFPDDGGHNGYRLDLYNMLTAAGVDPQFIGTQSSGTNNPQPLHEGYGWRAISNISDYLHSNGILGQQPNLVLLHAGTNDNDLPQTSNDPLITFANAPDRLGELIDYILCNDPDAVVLVAKLIQNKYNQAQTNAFNDAVPSVVGERYMKGYKVRVVDMSMIGGSELTDLLHPDDYGYSDMANRWFSAIMGIPDSWWTTSSSAQPLFGGPLVTCARDSVSFKPAIDGQPVAPGYHVDGDPAEPPAQPEIQGDVFAPGWSDNGIIAIGTGNPGSGVLFADLDGDGLNDYIWANYSSGSEGSIHAWLNGGIDVWNAVNNGDSIAWGEPGTTYVELADLTGDKKADYILIANGQFKIFENEGPNGQIWNWNEMTNAENQLNYIFGDNAPFHYFADMNGDGFADLIVYNPNGVLDIYFNSGPDGNGGLGWTQCRNIGIATGKPIFVDIDGDGTADYVSMDDDGGLSGWINKKGSGACDISWIPINGRGPKSLALGAGAPASEVRLADFTGDKKADYLVVDDNGGAVHLYPNTGSTRPPDSNGVGGYAAAVRFNDMDGDGRDDYVSVTNYSGISVWLNGGQSGNNWTWNEQADGHVIALGYSGATRHEVHLADMNADGRDDYLIVDADTGALHCYLNYGPTSGAWSWNIMGEIAIGVGGVGAGVRLADFDGDGRADYIYLDENGSATVWLNNGAGNNLEHWQAINGGAIAALGVGAHRDDIQFADIDGDGRADYCWIHPDTGLVEVWYNLWDGKTVGWASGGTLNVASGPGSPGQNIRLARIGTSGRYDYVALEEDTGAFRAWINDCANVLTTTSRAIAGSCQTIGNGPLPTQGTSETVQEPASRVSTDAQGHTVVQGPSGGQITIPFGISAATTVTEPDGVVITYIPGGNTAATTIVANGETIIQGSLGDQTTVPVGITQATVITETNGEVVTYDPSPGNVSPSNIETLTKPDGQTVTLTLPPGSTITGQQTITTDGSTITVAPVPTFTDGPVTSTMTTLPPSFSIQDFTNFPISNNIWLTTTGSDSSTTIVPVLLPCPTCKPKIIWDLPPIPDIEFTWPQFPQLPKFHLPCVKVFGVHISGDCPSSSGPPPTNDGPPESPEPSESSSPSSASERSSSSCSTATVTDFFVSCTTISSNSVSCTTTSSLVTAGCSVTESDTTTTASECSLYLPTEGVTTTSTVTITRTSSTSSPPSTVATNSAPISTLVTSSTLHISQSATPSGGSGLTSDRTSTSSVCQPAVPTSTSGVFFLFKEDYRSCSGGHCSDSFSEAGIVAGDDWNCNALAAVDFDNTDFSSYPYASGSIKPAKYVMEDTQHVCNTNALTFVLQCDGTYFVSSENQGGNAICSTNLLPSAISACTSNGKQADFEADLRCVGNIC